MTVVQDTHDTSRIDREMETAFVSYDWDSDESIAETIVSTVAKLSNAEPEDIDRLYDRIDPDSLETIFEPANESIGRNAGHVSFSFETYTVTIHATGTIVVSGTA